MLDADKIAIKDAVEQKDINSAFNILSQYKGADLLAAVTVADLKNYVNDILEKSTKDGRLDIIEALFSANYLTDFTIGDFINVTARHGNLELVKYFHNLGAEEDIDYYPAISGAIRNGHIDIVGYLIDKEDIALTADAQYAEVAVESGNLEMVKFLVAKGAFGSSACYAAAAKGHTNIVQYFLEDPEYSEADYIDLYLNAAMKSGHIEMIKFLVDKGAKLRSDDGNINSAIIKKDYHIADLVEGKHNYGVNPQHDAYKQMEDPLLKHVNPLVYKVDLSKIEEYVKLAGELKIVMLLFDGKKLPGDLLTPFFDKYNIPNLDVETALRLNFPTKEEIEKVALDASPQAKTWIALLEKNQSKNLTKY